MTTVAGIVDGDTGNIVNGKGFTSARTGNGEYTITFEPSFSIVYGVATSIVSNGASRHSSDGAQVTSITSSLMNIRTGGGSSSGSDRTFSFIVTGE